MVDKYHFIITNLDAHTIDLEPFQYSGANITVLRMVDTASTFLAEYGEYLKKTAEAEKPEGEGEGNEESEGGGEEQPDDAEKGPDEENAEGNEETPESPEGKEEEPQEGRKSFWTFTLNTIEYRTSKKQS